MMTHSHHPMSYPCTLRRSSFQLPNPLMTNSMISSKPCSKEKNANSRPASHCQADRTYSTRSYLSRRLNRLHVSLDGKNHFSQNRNRETGRVSAIAVPACPIPTLREVTPLGFVLNPRSITRWLCCTFLLAFFLGYWFAKVPPVQSNQVMKGVESSALPHYAHYHNNTAKNKVRQ